MSDRRATIDRVPAGTSGADLWVFGYGSLMWRPDFPFAEAHRARVDGWKRGFFIYSTHHRGNPARPGLVLALDRGGSCEGIAYRITSEHAHATLAYLRAREQVNGVYRQARLQTRIEDGSGRIVEAMAFVVERCHPSYAGQLPLTAQARLIRAARGISGPNLCYLVATVRHLEEQGVREPGLRRLLALAGPLFARKPDDRALQEATSSLLAACRRFPATAPRLPLHIRRRFLHRRQIAQWTTAAP